MAKIIIPTPLRKFTNNEGTIELSGETVIEAIERLGIIYPNLRGYLINENGSLRNFLRIYVGDEDIKVLQNENTFVDDSSIISIIPAIAGGLN